MAAPIEKLLDGSREIPGISPETAESFAQAADSLLRQVNEKLEARPNIQELIGRNPARLMRDHLRNQATFMSTVFSINSFELLVRTLPWIYRAYLPRGFSSDYFFAELLAWQDAIRQCPQLQATQKTELLAVYTWLIQHHEEMTRIALDEKSPSNLFQPDSDEKQQLFLVLLLNGDSRGCLQFAEQSVHTVADLKSFYLDVVWPSLVIIGELWLSNQISVAEEHLATAVVGRVMSALYPRFAQFSVTRAKAVVAAVPNEFHEVGARMVADFMELDGWDVTYLGANTPSRELLVLIKQQKPFVVALSVATVFNIEKLRHLIKTIKNDEAAGDVKIMIGGHVFSDMPHLWQDFGADGYAPDAESAVRRANEWWLAGNES